MQVDSRVFQGALGAWGWREKRWQKKDTSPPSAAAVLERESGWARAVERECIAHQAQAAASLAGVVVAADALWLWEGGAAAAAATTDGAFFSVSVSGWGRTAKAVGPSPP